MAGGDATPSDVPDVLAPDLRIVFVGINPGRVSAAARAHFANPRNDFWRLLHAARLTSRLYEPQRAVLPARGGDRRDERRLPHDTRLGRPAARRLRRALPSGSSGSRASCGRGWLAFVGKEAYRGAFGARPELGLQERTLGDTRLFVLPSTSPANAAVPWDERLRWFRELAGRESGLPERQNVRAAVVDERGRILLLRYGDEYGDWWVTPGGGREAGESRRANAPPRARGGDRPRRVRARPAALGAAAAGRGRSPVSGAFSPASTSFVSIASSRRTSPRRTRLAGSRLRS